MYRSIHGRNTDVESVLSFVKRNAARMTNGSVRLFPLLSVY